MRFPMKSSNSAHHPVRGAGPKAMPEAAQRVDSKPIHRGAVLAVAVLTLGWGGLGGAQLAGAATKAQKCEAAKLKASSNKAKCLLRAQAEWVLSGQLPGTSPDTSQCEADFLEAFETAEAGFLPGECTTVGDATEIEGLIDAGAEDVATLLSGGSLEPPAQFPATGQTRCWDGTEISCAGTGQDGDIQAGGPLSYTDNEDGTITDNNTGLVWQKGNGAGPFTWNGAFDHVVDLNTEPCFAGTCDWRVPNVKELGSIVDYARAGPSMDPIFETTVPISYWSSTSLAVVPGAESESAWVVQFDDGFVEVNGKNNNNVVRAVRGGLQ